MVLPQKRLNVLLPSVQVPGRTFESKPDFNGVMFVRTGETRHAIPVIRGQAFNHVRDGRDMLEADTRFVFEIDMRPGATAE